MAHGGNADRRGGAALALTMGDPAGIGPEIALKALAMPDLAARPVVIGDEIWLRRLAERLGLDLEIRAIAEPEASAARPGLVEVIDVARVPSDLPLGVVDARAGAVAYAYVRRGIAWAVAGRLAGLVTAPINKASLAAAGVPFPGHTEMLAHHAGVPDVAMMLANDELRVVLVTIHMALADAVQAIDRAAVVRAIRFADAGCRALGVTRPRVAVAGLNPHAGEGGLFGREEIEIITPAIADARADGIDASGPWPGDGVFRQARAGQFDVVVAQYHDQGLIPIKYLSLADGVNVTLGLPFVRTSPDHGTAFDIADDDVADPSSLRAAINLGARMCLICK